MSSTYSFQTLGAGLCLSSSRLAITEDPLGNARCHVDTLNCQNSNPGEFLDLAVLSHFLAQMIHFYVLKAT